MTTKEELIEKLRGGGQITVEDLESLGPPRKKDPSKRPAKVCSPKYAVAKAKKGEKLNKWELEDLAQSPAHAVEYAQFTGVRFPECETHLLLDNTSGLITTYFIEVVKERDERFEEWLLKEEGGAECIPQYCMEVLKSRWKEGEEAILKIEDNWNRGIDADYALGYQKEMIRGAWGKLERVLLSRKNEVCNRKSALRTYFENCAGKRDEGTESRLLKFNNTSAIFMYARHCVGGKLPEALHNKMILSGKKSAKNYLRWLASRKKMLGAYLATLSEEERAELIGSFPETIQTGG